MPDIESPDDVAHLVREFYARVYRDDALRPIFQDVASVDLEEHLPKMNRFWESVLLAAGSYRGNPLEIHLQLHRLIPLTESHFARWLAHFERTVDELFRGPRATYAKEAAGRIATRFRAVIEGNLPETRGSYRPGVRPLYPREELRS